LTTSQSHIQGSGRYLRPGRGTGLTGGRQQQGSTWGAINKRDTLFAEFQLEGEAWPKLSDKNYAYLSYAFSPGKYFPGHRAAVEVWQVLPEGWAVSAGLTYYRFDRNIFISVLSVEKYINRFWLNLRGFLYFKDDGIRLHYILMAGDISTIPIIFS